MSERRKRGLFDPPPPEARLVEDPYRERWRPRREAVGVDGDEIQPHRLTHAERLTDASSVPLLHLVRPLPTRRGPSAHDPAAEASAAEGTGAEDEEGLVPLPDVPPIQPGEPDDLRLPNPDRWGPAGERGLPLWFWGVMALAAVGVGLWIVWGQGRTVAPASFSEVGEGTDGP